MLPAVGPSWPLGQSSSSPMSSLWRSRAASGAAKRSSPGSSHRTATVPGPLSAVARRTLLPEEGRLDRRTTSAALRRLGDEALAREPSLGTLLGRLADPVEEGRSTEATGYTGAIDPH